MKVLDKRYSTKYHISMIENLVLIQENGSVLIVILLNLKVKRCIDGMKNNIKE